MTQPRLPHHRATPDRVGGDDAAAVPCAGRPEPYDVLIDLTGGAAFRTALAQARAICATCPVAIACLRANRDEPWAMAVATGKNAQQRTAANRPLTPAMRRSHSRNAAAMAAFNAERRNAIEDWIAVGLTLPDVLNRLGLNRDAFRKWAQSNAPDLWERLTAKEAA